MTPKILVVLTSVDKFPSEGLPTGWFLPEFSHPYDVLSPIADIVVASPKGGIAPLDPVSIELFKNDALSVDFYANKKFLWEETTPLKQFLGRSSEFVALLYPGGHGPMFDLVQDEDSIRLIEEFITADKPVAAICHGPISFINVIVNGQPLAKGRRLTGYSNDEESAAKRTSLLPCLLEDELKKKGAKYEKAAVLLHPKVVIDGKIITGQNPASAKGVAEALAKAIAG